MYDVVDNEPAASLLELSSDGRIIASELDWPDTVLGLLPANSGKGIFTVNDHSVFSLDLDTLNQNRTFSIPYGWSKDKEYRYDGVSNLLECYHGRLTVYKVIQP